MMQRRLPRPSRRRSVIISIFSPPVLVLFANDGVGTRYPRRHLHHMPLCERITCGCRTGRSAGPTAINGGVRIRNLLRFTASNSRHSTRVIHPASRHLRPKTIFVFSFFFFSFIFSVPPDSRSSTSTNRLTFGQTDKNATEWFFFKKKKKGR